MAATGATRSNRTTRTADRNRSPLTSARRGERRAAAHAKPAETHAAPAAAPAMHITPNVAIVARGGLRGARPERAARWLQLDASDLRRFRA
ncbi:MAG: hypothetical protein AVDCRST_MAG38-300 [uncultured Solirubrobacteraceae bacterium]|uniref:Uncharacterized protein n=1 Tax=uncultured Solirubrobacteraceae bacterium TaxID=1162706 RepID=A0A6J4R7S9_9ACTN|nr:MAG: hypothetical protein AVDCRST_MAG38-300 [uncultured Solirubrobacteraceae bacterium]